MSKRVREKCGKLCIFSILSSKRDITPTKISGNWRHSNLICSTVKQSHMQNFSSICQSMQEKSAKNCTFYLYSKFTKRHISFKNWRKVTTLELDSSTLKQSHVQNFSSICQSMYEKSAENGRTETQTESRTDGQRVGRTDGRRVGRTDGHHHTIIRPVWRRAYKK